MILETIKCIIASLLLYLIPFSYGNLILKFSLNSNDNSLSTNLTKTLFGFIFLTCLMYTSEFYGYTQPVFIFLTYFGVLLSLYTTFTLKNEISKLKLSENNIIYLSIIVIIFFTFFFYKVYFYEWPNIVLHQLIHFQKGALELSKFGTLNPNTANAYIPVLQVFHGFLHKIFNLNLTYLKSFSFVTTSFFWLSATYCLLKFFLNDKSNALKATLLTSSLVIVQILTNNELSIITSLVLFKTINNFWQNCEAQKTGNLKLSIFLITLSILLLSTASLFVFYQRFLIFLIISLFIIKIILKEKFNDNYFLIILLSIICVSFHRIGVLLFLTTTMLTIIAGYFRFKNLETLYLILGVLLAMLGIAQLSLGYYLKIVHQIDIHGRYFWEFVNLLTENIFSKKINPSDLLDTGGGLKNLLYEFVRKIPISSFAIFIPIFTFKGISEKLKLMFGTTGLLLFVTLSGLPYTYRILPFTVIFYSALVVTYLENCSKNKKKISFVTYVFFYSIELLSINYLIPLEKLKFFHQLIPINIAFIITFILIVLINKKEKYQNTSTYIGIAAILFINILTVRSAFLTYSYGQNTPKTGIKHSSKDLHVIVKNLPKQAYFILSDPITMNNIKAETGRNGFYGGANLSDISLREPKEESLNALKMLIILAFECKNEKLKESLTNFISSPPASVDEMIYFAIKNEVIEYNKLFSRVVLIVNNRTLRWAYCKTDCPKDYDKINYSNSVFIPSKCMKTIETHNLFYQQRILLENYQ